MTHIILEQESSSKAQRGSKKSLRLTLMCATIGIIAISFVLKNSLKSKLILFSEHKYKRADSTASCKQDNVFNHEIAITYFPQNIHQRISKFRCTGSENDIRAWKDRLCVFYNTCYNRDSGHFYYFRPSGSKAKPIFYDSAKGMLFEFSLNNGSTEFVSLAPDGHTPWGPIISNETYPLADFTILHQLHSLMKSRHAQNSIAHGLWEDLGSISYSMERMNIFDQKLVIMHLEWHTIPFKKQIEKLLKTTILITPCGGVSLIIPMLPHGAHAIVMDYYVSVAAHGFHAGERGSMEGAFLNHISHVRKQYYQVYGRSDYEFDYPGTSDTREQASIIVNMTRLQLLIDKALEEMEP
ncbi:unnamed protein product [Rotaria magnacalcarata]|uniref:Uncharacterized protein n=1 Tax=Rotaria magnacalcarata TaxID=392030 RepID=A0A815EUK4_9BILA|nr:unnamed protein product [Rotaria magnacalcarata]CAF4884579.1 unnamed protein product [Rotaria magnacalcarata]